MRLLRFLFLIAFTSVTLVSCKKDNKIDEGDIAYFGGEVVNPIKDFVIITKSDKALDTITLDENNRFIYKVKPVESGLYTFRLWAAQGLEYQMVLLEPQDSIMFRLNTMEFDETLVFSGKGAKKNNYLINLFLEGEIEDKEVLGLCQLPVTDFTKRIDSIRNSKLDKLNYFIENYDATPAFNEIAEANINYDYYLSKEVYPFVNYVNSERKTLESLPEDFYSYRKDVNYDHKMVRDYFPYSSFLKYHFENMALAKYFEKTDDSVFNIKSLDYNLIRLNLIDSLVTDKELKNSLLMEAAVEFITKSKDVDKFDPLLESFKSKCTDGHQQDYVTNLINSLKSLKPGNPIPQVEVTDFNNVQKTIRSLIKRPTVIYFWSTAYRTHIDSHKKAFELKQKYPEVDFIAINVNVENDKLWRKIIKEHKYNSKQEYVFKNPKEARHQLAIYPINKVIILDDKAEIVNAHTNMFYIGFEDELLGLLNR
ncbi:TlpA family protein disulfide reductase [Hanstruepera marina]|uniref:TlpA family protein disulfide reductase n=1 Tax=Hanstruepera marina TaxID=2873265 RepID=UPI001CA656E4|nr:hypothetical protein [Hanstruepera marina]